MSHLKDQLIKLGSDHPELRDHLRPVIDHLTKRAGRGQQAIAQLRQAVNKLNKSVDAFENVRVEVDNAFIKRPAKIIDRLHMMLNKDGDNVVLWWSDIKTHTLSLIQMLTKLKKQGRVPSGAPRLGSIISSLERAFESSRDINEQELAKEWTEDDQEEKGVPQVFVDTFRDVLDSLSPRGHSPEITRSRNSVTGFYKAQGVSKEFDQQTQRQWDKARKKARKKMTSLERKFSDIVRDIDISRGDKNFMSIEVTIA